MFKALLLKQEENKKATATVEDIDVSKLPEGDVLVKINYSTINYKDSLAITSSSPIVKIPSLFLSTKAIAFCRGDFTAVILIGVIFFELSLLLQADNTEANIVNGIKFTPDFFEKIFLLQTLVR